MFTINRTSPGSSAALEWIERLMLGTAATGVAILAIAILGLLTLQGRLDWRRGSRVILGCFLIFGAPVIAAGLLGRIDNPPVRPSPTAEADIDAPPPPPPRNQPFDPYAGAAVQRTW